MKYILTIMLMAFSHSAISSVCPDDAIVNSSDSFKRSATIYFVCPQISDFTDSETKEYLQALITLYSPLAPEIFIQFLASKNYIGYMENVPYRISGSELVADYYSGTDRLYFWPGTENERFITIDSGHQHKP